MRVKQKSPQRSYTGIKWRTNRENKKRLIYDFEHRCAYCDDPDKYSGGSRVYHVEHFAPKEKFPELEFQYDNLLYACPFCNISKSNKWPSDSSTVTVVGNKGFVDPCTDEYDKHLGRYPSGEIYYITQLGMYMYYEMKLYLQRHRLIYNLGRIHEKLKEVKKEIDRKKQLHKPTEELQDLYKELCVIFYEYYDAFSEDVK